MADGHDYAQSAYNAGCRVFIAERKIELPDDCFIIITGDTRIALASLSAAFFGYPAKEMKVIGITGTKGKTTCSLLIYNILNESGIPAGYIGSNGVHYGDQILETKNTTPESYDLHEIMREMLDSGVKTLVMEVSSQALKLSRVHGIKFQTCVFTNLSPEHLDDHGTMEDYKQSKMLLFPLADKGVVNLDDAVGGEFASIKNNGVIRFGIDRWKECDLYAKDIQFEILRLLKSVGAKIHMLSTSESTLSVFVDEDKLVQSEYALKSYFKI